MVQAVGAQGQITFVEEVSWGVTPGSPSMKLLKAAVYGESLGAEIETLRSNSINANRAQEEVRGGVKTAGGSIPYELAILGMGTMMKHALGPVVTTGAGPTYTHVIKRGALPPGLSVEKGFTDIGQYFVYDGCKINSMSQTIDAKGLVTGTFDFAAKGLTASGTTLGAPSSSAHNPVVSHEATTVEENGVAATLFSLDWNLTNNLDTDRFQVGSRDRISLTEGKGDMTGNVGFLFEDLVVFNKWLNETESSLKIIFTVTGGTVEYFWPKIKYFGDSAPKMETDQGIVIVLPFEAVYDSVEATDLRITINNTEATI